MSFSDPVANMLAVIRNANLRGYRTVSFPYSSFKQAICQKLQQTNFLSQFWFDEKNHRLKVEIKYSNRRSLIHELKKISTPSRHIHLRVKELNKFCRRSYGTYIISTSRGLLTDREALVQNTGGKVILCIN